MFLKVAFQKGSVKYSRCLLSSKKPPVKSVLYHNRQRYRGTGCSWATILLIVCWIINDCPTQSINTELLNSSMAQKQPWHKDNLHETVEALWKQRTHLCLSVCSMTQRGLVAAAGRTMLCTWGQRSCVGGLWAFSDLLLSIHADICLCVYVCNRPWSPEVLWGLSSRWMMCRQTGAVWTLNLCIMYTWMTCMWVSVRVWY